MALLTEFYQGKNVLITGGSGFIGRNLSRRLNECGAKVFIIDNREKPNELTASFSRCDITDYSQLRDIFAGISPQIVFHLAATISRASEFDMLYRMIDVNLVGTVNLFNCLRQVTNLQSVVVAGTAEEYGINTVPFRENLNENPTNPYSFSKTCVSHLCRLAHSLFDIPVSVLRATLAYGPGQEEVMLIPSLIESLLRNQSFLLSAGEQTRDFLFIDDLVEAYLLAGSNKSAFGEIFNIGSGKSYKIKDIAHKIGRILGKEHLLSFGKVDYRKSEIMDYQVDFSKARNILNWMPKIDIDEGLRLTNER
ncbi:NAD-dependent epimerase/dehydratase family protein [Chloroflexota bacterium]